VVDVHLHDLVFRVVAFDLEGHQPFVNFALKRLRFRQKKVLGELLRQGGAALAAPGSEILPGHAGDADGVDSYVIVKARILDGEDGVFNERRNLRELERDAFFQRELADHCLAVVGVDARDDARAISRERCDFLRGARMIDLISQDDAGHAARGNRQEQHDGQPEASQKTAASRRGSGCGGGGGGVLTCGRGS
jgi:hypothetical protein